MTTTLIRSPQSAVMTGPGNWSSKAVSIGQTLQHSAGLTIDEHHFLLYNSIWAFPVVHFGDLKIVLRWTDDSVSLLVKSITDRREGIQEARGVRYGSHQ